MMFWFALFIAGWAVAALLGVQAYFWGQSKPIHSYTWFPKFYALVESPTAFVRG